MAKIRLDMSSVIKKRDDLVSAPIDKETALMSIEQGNYYGIDEVGTRIWEIISDETTVSDLCGKLLDEFEVDEETCREETLRFLEDLASEKLIVIS